MIRKNDHQLLHVLIIFVTAILLLLGYVGLKLRIDYMKKEIVMTNELIKQLQNQQTKLLADAQFLSSEERIVPIAIEELQLEKKSPLYSVSISRSELQNFVIVGDKLNEQ
jgi:cell division protein FtsL